MATTRLFLHVFVYFFRLNRGRVNIAVAVNGDAFRRRKFRITDRWRRDVEPDFAVLDAAAADSSFAARVIGILTRSIFGFGIGDVKHVVLIDENPTGPPELFPGAEKFPFLIEDRDAAVAPVGNKEPPLAIEGEHVWSLQLAVP